jgi:hypothetical protein
MAATLPLPSASRGFRSVIAENVRVSELTEMDGTAPPVELPLLALVEEELLQAAAARPKASDTDTTAPFLATRIIKTTSRRYRKGRIQACANSSPAWQTSRP